MSVQVHNSCLKCSILNMVIFLCPAGVESVDGTTVLGKIHTRSETTFSCIMYRHTSFVGSCV